MSRKAKIWLVVGSLFVAAAVAAGFWFFGMRQEATVDHGSQTSTGASAKEEPQSNTPPLTGEAASGLVTKMLSPDRAVFEAAWSQPTELPMPPSGTSLTIQEETLEFYDVAGHAKATLTMPGEAPSEVDMLFEYTDEGWKIRTIQ